MTMDSTNGKQPTGLRKFKGYAYTTLSGLGIYAGALVYCALTKQAIESVMPLVTASFFSIGSTYGIFAGSNSVVHATTKDKAA